MPAKTELMHLVIARTILRRKRHESVMSFVMGSDSSSDPERSQNAAPQEAPRPARNATEQQVNSSRSVDFPVKFAPFRGESGQTFVMLWLLKTPSAAAFLPPVYTSRTGHVLAYAWGGVWGHGT